HIRYAASSAAASGNLQGLRVIRALGVDIGKPVPGRGPLIISAAWTGQTNVVAYLLSAGVDIETKDKFGGTALSRAAEMNQTDTVRLLLDHGANPNVRDLEGGNTPIDLCYLNAIHKGIDPTPTISLIAAAGGKANTSNE
ncbi:MAG TPA: ankyrin repeat domain-containing protein, partial [Verrucomicrobiae bacterium]|nr:ankyrin repeat domain-containing protein [Verrucomicrobiae bacterium]